MVGAAVFMYGMLMSFVFSGASRNAKLKRPNPPMMLYVGYVLCGASAGLSLFLLAHVAAMQLGIAI